MFHDGPFQHQELKLGRMIVLLMSSESSTTIGNRVILPICLFLGKYQSQSLLRSICFEQKVLSVVGKSKDRGAHTGLFQSLKGF